MEYTDYWVVKGEPTEIRTRLQKVAKKGVVVDVDESELVAFVVEGYSVLDAPKKLAKQFEWMLGVWDAEGSAWGFDLWIDGKVLASATYGENAEWGIDEDQNGFEGDVAATAKALGMTKKKLEKFLDEDGVEKFCKAVGFGHHYTLYPRNLPKGVMLMSEMM